ERELAGVRIRRRVLGADAEVAVAPRDPVRLAAPAAVDDPVLEGKDRPECGHRPRREFLLEARDEPQAGGGDLQHQRERNQRASRSRSPWVMCVAFPSGIALSTTACSRIALAWASIS